MLDSLRAVLESDGRFEVVDLHVWSIGPGYRAAIVAVSSTEEASIQAVSDLVPGEIGIAHLTVELRVSDGRL
ncbi:MAG: hypothetical protein GY906_13655 [bacterium]|nr:hypothetical protein [bacterium]